MEEERERAEEENGREVEKVDKERSEKDGRREGEKRFI
jgi:hypothetical protein